MTQTHTPGPNTGYSLLMERASGLERVSAAQHADWVANPRHCKLTPLLLPLLLLPLLLHPGPTAPPASRGVPPRSHPMVVGTYWLRWPGHSQRHLHPDDLLTRQVVLRRGRVPGDTAVCAAQLVWSRTYGLGLRQHVREARAVRVRSLGGTGGESHVRSRPGVRGD